MLLLTVDRPGKGWALYCVFISFIRDLYTRLFIILSNFPSTEKRKLKLSPEAKQITRPTLLPLHSSVYISASNSS